MHSRDNPWVMIWMNQSDEFTVFFIWAAVVLSPKGSDCGITLLRKFLVAWRSLAVSPPDCTLLGTARSITMEMGDDGKGRGLTWRRACGSWSPRGFPPEGSYVFCLRLLRAEGGPVVKSLTAPCGLGLSEGGFLGASGKLSWERCLLSNHRCLVLSHHLSSPKPLPGDSGEAALCAGPQAGGALVNGRDTVPVFTSHIV